MLESPKDRIGGGHVTIHGSKLAVWEQLCMSLQILDAWFLAGIVQAQGSLSFLRLISRLEGSNLARLGRFYISDALRDREGTTFLDHDLVVLVLEEQRRPAQQQLCIPKSI